jgi:hypothetical protein
MHRCDLGVIRRSAAFLTFAKELPINELPQVVQRQKVEDQDDERNSHCEHEGRFR